MKKILLSFMLLVGLKATSQTVDTSITWATASKINSVVVQKNYPLKDTITHIGVFDYTDDLKGSCVVNYTLIASSTKRNVIQDAYKLTDSQYADWDGSAVGLLRFLATYLSVTFK